MLKLILIAILMSIQTIFGDHANRPHKIVYIDTFRIETDKRIKKKIGLSDSTRIWSDSVNGFRPAEMWVQNKIWKYKNFKYGN